MPSTLRDRRTGDRATLAGLTAHPKHLPTVWLYDERGSRLYEEVAQLTDYYLPRREAEILLRRAPTIAEKTRARTLIELGSGGARNTRHLLDALGELETFVLLDVSESTLRASADAIKAAYPALSVRSLAGDFERDLGTLPPGSPRLVAFLGSTIGNLLPDRRRAFLKAVAASLGEGDSFLVGLDLVKDVAPLEAAYNDEGGVTEAFVRNALTAVNTELGATFDQALFSYEARWDARQEWMEIGLRALQAHEVSIPGLERDVAFETDELLRVEVSAKFRRESFECELARSGLRLDSWWTDDAGDYAIALSIPEASRGD